MRSKGELNAQTARLIREHRKRLGLTQVELGLKLGVQNNAVSKWENGRVGDIPASKVVAMARLFGITPSELMGYENANDIPIDLDMVKYALFGTTDGITDEMLEEVKRYARFIMKGD